jgi:hypothetical protein
MAIKLCPRCGLPVYEVTVTDASANTTTRVLLHPDPRPDGTHIMTSEDAGLALTPHMVKMLPADAQRLHLHEAACRDSLAKAKTREEAAKERKKTQGRRGRKGL